MLQKLKCGRKGTLLAGTLLTRKFEWACDDGAAPLQEGGQLSPAGT